MKRGILFAFAIRKSVISRFSSLFIILLLSMNLSGQKTNTILAEKWTTTWVTDSRQTLTYDVNDHLLNQLSESYDGASWNKVFQINYQYNVDGTMHQATTQQWSGGIWNDFSRITYTTYNASKKVLTTLSEIWLVALWQNSSQQTNTYDLVTGYLNTTESQSWNGASFQNSSKSIFTNDGNGNPTLEIFQLWDGAQYINSTRSTSTYNGSDKILTTISDKWKSGGGPFEPDHRETYLYDVSGYLFNDLLEAWDGVTGTPESQTNYENNPDGTIFRATDQTWATGVWTNTERFTYTYGSPTGFSEFSSDEKDFTLYPNPASDFIRIKTDKSISGSAYTFTDQSGKTVLKGIINSENNSIDITSLENGIYFLHIGESSQHSYKVIKNK
jgi:hypothetical protein